MAVHIKKTSVIHFLITINCSKPYIFCQFFKMVIGFKIYVSDVLYLVEYGIFLFLLYEFFPFGFL